MLTLPWGCLTPFCGASIPPRGGLPPFPPLSGGSFLLDLFAGADRGTFAGAVACIFLHMVAGAFTGAKVGTFPGAMAGAFWSAVVGASLSSEEDTVGTVTS